MDTAFLVYEAGCYQAYTDSPDEGPNRRYWLKLPSNARTDALIATTWLRNRGYRVVRVPIV